MIESNITHVARNQTMRLVKYTTNLKVWLDKMLSHEQQPVSEVKKPNFTNLGTVTL